MQGKPQGLLVHQGRRRHPGRQGRPAAARRVLPVPQAGGGQRHQLQLPAACGLHLRAGPAARALDKSDNAYGIGANEK